MKLSHMTWPQVESYLESNKAILIPIGSVEQHGPTGLIGTDELTATAVAEKIAYQHQILVAPPLSYGMARHHLAFPGTISLSPRTLSCVIVDVVESLACQGFQQILFVNGHGGNIPTLSHAFCELKANDCPAFFKAYHWWQRPSVQDYERENFGDNVGFHATVGEVSVTQFLHPQAFENIPHKDFEIEKKAPPWPLSATEFRREYPDGRVGSNPGLATSEHGKKIFEIAVNDIAGDIERWIKACSKMI